MRTLHAVILVVFFCGCSKTSSEKPNLNDAEAFYRQGTELLESDPAKAVELLAKSLELAPDAPPARYNRALALARLGRDNEAVDEIKQLERIAPKLAKELRGKMELAAGAYVDLAHRELEKKNFDASVKKCDSALAYNPTWGDAWAVKGHALLGLGQTDEALACLNKGVEVEPDNYFVYIARGEFYHKQKRLPEALADYTKSIELEPTVDAYQGRSAVYFDSQMPEKGKIDKEKAEVLKAKPNGKGGP